MVHTSANVFGIVEAKNNYSTSKLVELCPDGMEDNLVRWGGSLTDRILVGIDTDISMI